MARMLAAKQSGAIIAAPAHVCPAATWRGTRACTQAARSRAPDAAAAAAAAASVAAAAPLRVANLQRQQLFNLSTAQHIRARGSGGITCRGFVGEGSRIAGQYYDQDFDWEEVVTDGQAAVARQLREWAEWRAQQPAEDPGHDAVPSSATQDGSDAGSKASTTDCQLLDASVGASSSSELSGEADELDSAAEGASWERFHSTHSQARFFKEKRYLMLEFPALGALDPPQHIAEIGCGCGSALLPVLKANPSCRVTGCDVSPTALALLHRAAEQAGVEGSRIRTFVLDASSRPNSSLQARGLASSSSGTSSSSASLDTATSGDSRGCAAGSPLAGLEADSVLLIFTLSALRPEDQPAVLAHAYAALRPGGLLLFRDYGLYDMAQLRFPGSQMLGDCLYRRSEGTLAYFFSTQALRSLAADAGFEEVECQYARVQLRNRKNGTAMRRVFVHGVFRKPADSDS